MKNPTIKKDDMAKLRKKAEDLLRNNPFDAPEIEEADRLKLLHELQVHQIELEMQNEELKRTKFEAETTAEKYKELYDFAPSGYFTLSKDGAIIELNLNGANLLGQNRSSLINKTFSLFVAHNTQREFSLFLDTVFKSRIKQSCEVILPDNGDPRSVYLTGIVTENENFCFIIAIDITEHKQIERALNNIQKLESLSVLAGGIAHNFIHFLRSIYGDMHFAFIDSPDTPGKVHLSTAMTSLKEAENLMYQLLSFSKDDTASFKIDTLVPLIQKKIEFALEGSNISTQFNIAPDLWKCSFDRNQIVRLIENLVINAREAMPDGGTIEISAHNVHVGKNAKHLLSNDPSLKTDDPYVKISVKDYGKGIDPEHLKQIFDPFFTTKPKRHGLGLAICYSIAKKHGGFIEAEPDEDGSTFHFYLPAIIESA